ncbi:MAG: hypothetical protein WC004_01875 [Candidatus Absconditabacterales bacterium]
MESPGPGGKSAADHMETAIAQTIGFFTQMIAKGLDGIEQIGGARKAIAELPEGIVDVGAYFLLQEPGKEGYTLQVSKKHLLRGMNDSKNGSEAIRYMSSLDKQIITQKVTRLKCLHDTLCKNKENIGFSKKMRHDYFVLNRLDDTIGKFSDTHSIFMKELLNLIHYIYHDNLKELHDDMAIIRKSIIHQGGTNTDPYEYYKEWSKDPTQYMSERAQTDELRQHIKGRKALLVLMEEIERYPFKSITGKRETI